MRPWCLEAPEAPRIRLDVAESDGPYAIPAEIPGVRVDGKLVTISAEASCRDGLLERAPPKQAAASSKRLTIQ